VLLALAVGAVANLYLGGPAAKLLLGIALTLVLLLVAVGIGAVTDRIDSRLERSIKRSPSSFRVAAQDFPDYRFVDVFRAVEHYVGEKTHAIIDSRHNEDLGVILGGRMPAANANPTEPARTARPVSPSEDEFFPSDRFWVMAGDSPLLIRVHEQGYTNTTKLEVGAPDEKTAEDVVRAIRDITLNESIFRARAIEVSFTSGLRGEFGEIESQGRIRVEFRRTSELDPKRVVLDPQTWPIIQHSLVDLVRRRDEMSRVGVSVKRGLLFYGPPGTGKSLTCRYVASQLPGVTAIYCAGNALHQVGSIFNLARFFKPALVVLEDVDLVFAAREINTHAFALGDLFDQVDAIGDTEPIGMILTSNAIDRLEAALKNRPGRISQCVYFGPPSAELRRTYLEAFLGKHHHDALDLGTVVTRTEGASQAFLKELVQRALQFAVEGGRAEGDRLNPRIEDFMAGLKEMTAFDDKAVRGITGFRA
jgi:hypothetical protein